MATLPAFSEKTVRIDEEYLVQQVDGLRQNVYWRDHKARVSKFDTVYGGNLLGLQPEENTLENEPFVENKLKNAAHDIKRLAREARGTAVFTKEGEDAESATRAKMRSVITETIWQEGGGTDIEGLMYLDAIAGGFTAVAVYKNDDSDYPQFLRLNPRFAYPTVVNGRLRDMFYIESMKERQAAALFPDLKLDAKPGNTKSVEVVMSFDREEVCQAVVFEVGNTKRADIVSRWEHGLGRVPVAFRALDTADDRFRGLLDQLAGPLRARNRAVRLMIDYLEDMVHAPYEERGILNSDIAPGPTTVYHHDRDDERETFMRRVPPAAPAVAVFGLLNYLDSQEQSEGFQPPARVGTVRQSIASGSFVESTQGALSSVVLELQDVVARVRVEANKVALMIDERHLNREKPLVRAVGQKTTYKPKRDVKGWYYHKVMYGAAAGLDRREADSRILQHMGAGLINEDIARENIDYIENDTNIQDDVDRSLLRKVMFQKLVSDPNVPFSALAQIEQEMGRGKSRYDALKEVLPEILRREEEARQAVQAPAGAPAGGVPAAPGPEAERLALEKGAAPGAGELDITEFAPPFTTQVFGGTD